MTGLKPQKRPGVNSTLDYSTNNQVLGNVTFECVTENKGLEPLEDGYKKYDPEEYADEHLIQQGATIIRSEITITDSWGRNRTIVRRDNK